MPAIIDVNPVDLWTAFSRGWARLADLPMLQLHARGPAALASAYAKVGHTLDKQRAQRAWRAFAQRYRNLMAHDAPGWRGTMSSYDVMLDCLCAANCAIDADPQARRFSV